MTSLRPPSRLALRSRSRLPMAKAGLGQIIARRLFEQLQKGSRIPVRKVAPSPYSPPPSLSSPTSHSLSPKLSDNLEKRREARQARARPWAELPRRSASSSESSTSISISPQSSPDEHLVKRRDALHRSGAQPCSSPSSSESLSPSDSLSSLSDGLLEKRREARQKRARPWAQSQSPSSSSGRMSSTSPSSLSDGSLAISDELCASKQTSEQIKHTLPAVTVVQGPQPMSPVKKVSFGPVTVIDHPRWIDISEHVYQVPPREPVERMPMPACLSPHDALYWHDWTLRFSQQLDIHLARFCENRSCAWNSIARYRRWLPAWSNTELFQSWSFVALRLNKR